MIMIMQLPILSDPLSNNLSNDHVAQATILATATSAKVEKGNKKTEEMTRQRDQLIKELWDL